MLRGINELESSMQATLSELMKNSWNSLVKLSWTIIVVLLCLPLTSRNSVVLAELVADMPGDVILGGIFPLHEKVGYGCGPIRFYRGIQRAEAMFFAVDKVNKDPDTLPGITLGVKLVDSCSSDDYAMNQSLVFIRSSLETQNTSTFICADGANPRLKYARAPLVGVVGESYSSVTIQVANLLRLFAVPQISPAATSDTLSDKQRFEYFARTVPPDKYQAKALVDILVQFNWTYVSYVASEDEYGQKGIEMFLREARSKNICIAVAEKVPFNPTAETYRDIIQNLKRKHHARVVVVFVKQEHAVGLMEAARQAGLSKDNFIWLGTDQWGIQTSVVAGREEVAMGAITIELQSKPSGDFDKYFEGLYPGNPITVRNPWFLEFWETRHRCKVHPTAISTLWHHDPQLSPYAMAETDHSYKWRNSTWEYCPENLRITKDYQQDSKVPFVVNAVNAFAKALDALLRDDCQRRNLSDPCNKKLRVPSFIDGRLLYQYILNVSFLDDDKQVVRFDANGDGIGKYDLYNFQDTPDQGYHYVKVGEWTDNAIKIDSNRIHWPEMQNREAIPVSRCSEPCKMGEMKKLQEEACCWVCVECKAHEYLISEFQCQACDEFWYPNADQTGCFKLPLQHMEWDTIWAIAPATLACLGCVLTTVVILLFIRNNHTPIVRASGRDLTYLIFFGIFTCYCLTFVFLAHPSPVICAFQRFGVGFGFSVIYSALLTKTIRISRIFESSSQSTKRPKYISQKSQLIITSTLILVQVILSGIWLIIDPPDIDQSHPPDRRSEVVLKCKADDAAFLISLAYNMLLIIICTIYAVKTRKIPEDFNESKHIGFTMYTTCVIWLAFIPIYFGTRGDFKVQITTICASISLIASTCLFCLFFPKVFIIVLRPKKNIRKLTMNTTITYRKPNNSAATGSMKSYTPTDKIHKLNGDQTTAKMLDSRSESNSISRFIDE